MSACLVVSGDGFVDEDRWYHGQDKTNQSTLERITINDYELFLVKKHVCLQESKHRNHMVTFVINYLLELYGTSDFRIFKGPYLMFGYDIHTQRILDHDGLRNVARAIMIRMETAIYQGDYSLGISVVDGVNIKKTLF
jgi:hypothetical protein